MIVPDIPLKVRNILIAIVLVVLSIVLFTFLSLSFILTVPHGYFIVSCNYESAMIDPCLVY